MVQAGAEWMYDQAHEELPYHDGSFENWVAERSEAFPYHYRDGVRLWVSQDNLTPDDDFLTSPEPFRPSSVDYPRGGDRGDSS